MKSFLEWKKKIEEETQSHYVQNTAIKKCGNINCLYLNCNRSGSYNPKGLGKRLIKAQGSSKCGQLCTSNIKVREDVVSGITEVEFCSSHCNHEQEIAHLAIPDDVRMMISSKLSLGVKEEQIIDYIRSGCIQESDEIISREHLITKQDILNIKKKLNLGSVQKHANDHTSVCAWVRSMKYNPVPYFKPQGSMNDGENDLTESDFLLVIQTEFQRDLLLEHGNSVVCMDATHGTNCHDFQLITLLIIDSLGEGVPVAWAIANHEDTKIITKFLSAIKSKIGYMKPHYFMSDDADQYFNSWVKVFGNNDTTKLLCAWHVDRAWRKSLAKHVKDVKVRSEIYHQLRVLLLEQSETCFRLKLQQVVSYLIESEPRFCEYFQKEYASPNRIKLWATFNRINTGINTNMLESFHRKLKVCYFNQKQNKRVDSLLNVLVRISRDIYFDYLLKIKKGKYTYRITEINKRHKVANELILSGLKAKYNEGGKWIVQSQSQPEVSYSIQEQQLECTCRLMCTTCEACIHMYTCSCIDQALHATVCKHIHVVHTQKKRLTSETLPTPVVSSHNTETVLQPLQHYMQSGIQTSSNIKEKIMDNISSLRSLLTSCDDTSTLAAVSGHISSAVNVLTAHQAYSSLGEKFDGETRKYSPNLKHTVQRRFFSTRKKEVKSGNSLSKPTTEQCSEVSKYLSSVEVKVCGHCFCEDDNTSAEGLVNWTHCEQCQVWYHTACANGQIDFCINCGE